MDQIVYSYFSFSNLSDMNSNFNKESLRAVSCSKDFFFYKFESCGFYTMDSIVDIMWSEGWKVVVWKNGWRTWFLGWILFQKKYIFYFSK